MDSINQPNYERPLNQLCRLGVGERCAQEEKDYGLRVENKYGEASESSTANACGRLETFFAFDLDHLWPLFKAFAFHLFIGTIRAIPSREIADAVFERFFQLRDEAFARLKRNVEAAERDKREKTLRMIEQNIERIKQVPLGDILYEYGSSLLKTAPGQKAVIWKTLFVIAIGEHMLERRKRPDYRLASHYLDCLTTSTRSKKKQTAKQQNDTIRVQIYELKQQHPDWKSHIAELKNAFQSSQKR